MFQQVFRSQSSDVISWAVIGLTIFITVFIVRVLAIARTPRAEIAERAQLPLEDDHVG